MSLQCCVIVFYVSYLGFVPYLGPTRCYTSCFVIFGDI